CVFFFFQAEDGIRDRTVTGVQTCALPIFSPLGPTELARPTRMALTWLQSRRSAAPIPSRTDAYNSYTLGPSGSGPVRQIMTCGRSEERRVGKECRCRRARDPVKTKV